MNNTASGVTPERLANLRTWNIGLTILHAAQAILILILAGDFVIEITSNFPVGPPGTRLESPQQLFDLPIGPTVAIFLSLAALDHLMTATFKRKTYEQDLARGINRFRWVEYSISSTLMILTICLVFGIGDVAGLIGIAGANAAMILFGWLMEVINKPGREVWWTPFWFGCIVGILPWIGLLIYLFGPGSEMPKFVYGIFVSIFIFFNLFALNQFLQYRKNGRWADYVYGEKVYLWLSLIAKSALAWQLYGNTLSA